MAASVSAAAAVALDSSKNTLKLENVSATNPCNPPLPPMIDYGY